MTIGEHQLKTFTKAGHPKSDRMAQVASEILRNLYESEGFSITHAAPLHKQSHIDCAKHMLQLEPTFHVPTSSDIKKSSIWAITTVTQIPYETLKDWRRHLLVEPEWRPSQNRNAHRRALTEELRTEVAQEIQSEHLGKGFCCPPKVAQITAMRIWSGRPGPLPVRGNRSDQEEETEDEDNFEDCDELKEPETFTLMSEEEFFGLPTVDDRPAPDADEVAPDVNFDPAGSKDHGWDYRGKPPAFTRRLRAVFLKRQGLFLRHPHMRQLPAVHPDRELSFLEQMREVFAQFAPELIYNMDEMQWCLIS
jgi:hypothetical protein